MSARSILFNTNLITRLGNFPASWIQANVTPIPKGPPSSSVANYRPVSMISVMSKVFERLVSVRLERFMERCGVLHCNHPVCISERSLYLWWTFVRVPYTAKCIGEWAGGLDSAEWFQCSLWYGQLSGHSLYALLSGYWGFCGVYIDTVSIKPTTARYGGWLS